MTELAPAVRWSVTDNTDRAVSEFVARILKLAEPPAPVTERRRDRRFPFPHLLTLWPLDDHVIQTTGEPMTVIGKRLAERGLDFFHQHPLPFKRAIVTFDDLVPFLDLSNEKHIGASLFLVKPSVKLVV